MKRLDNWPTLLSKYFKSMMNVPFEFGKNDCGTFACGAVQAITGVDILKSLGPYTDEATEMAALKALAVSLGVQSTPIKRAQRGDLVAFKSLEGMTLLVVDGIYSLGPGEHGIRMVATSNCLEAWHIG